MIKERIITHMWTNDDEQYHRIDGPAIIWDNGDQSWYRNGLNHRDNGLPAYIGANGYREWWVNGKHHRIDGPAVDWVGDCAVWYFNGVRIFDEDIAEWMEEQAINPNWNEWTESEIVSFSLNFG